MCLIIPKRRAKKHIAKRDIVVWKTLHDGDDENVKESIYYSFSYTLGKLYTTEIKENSDYYFADLMARRDLIERLGELYASRVIAFGEGFHFYAYEKRITGMASGKCTKCIIPKGAEFYVWKGLGISNKMIVL